MRKSAAWFSAALTLFTTGTHAANDERMRDVAEDAFFQYRVKTHKEIGGGYYARWELISKWNTPLRVGAIKARYACPEGLASRTHYINKVVSPGIPQGHSRDPVCRGGHPSQIELLDIELRDPEDKKSHVVNCPNKPAAAGRYVLDARLAEKGIAQMTFPSGMRYTTRLGTGFSESELKKIATEVCGISEKEADRSLYGILRQLSAPIIEAGRERKRALDRNCRMGDAEACKEAKEYQSTRPAGASGA